MIVRRLRDALRRRLPLRIVVDALGTQAIAVAYGLVRSGLLGRARFFELIERQTGEDVCHMCVTLLGDLDDREDLDEVFDRELNFLLDRFGERAVLDALFSAIEQVQSGPRAAQLRAFVATERQDYQTHLVREFLSGDDDAFQVLSILGADALPAFEGELPEGDIDFRRVEWAMGASTAEEARDRLKTDV